MQITAGIRPAIIPIFPAFHQFVLALYKIERQYLFTGLIKRIHQRWHEVNFMNEQKQRTTIAYLAPEIPALSATFVYQEMLGLQKLGYSLLSISVHQPLHPAKGQDQLISKTQYLYDPSRLKLAISGLIQLPFMGSGTFRAIRLLLSDMAGCGLYRAESWKLAFQFLAAARVAALLISNKCAHLHVHFAHVPSQIAMYASAMSGVPFTLTAHANDIFERGLLLRQKADRAVRMITISEFNRNYLESIGVAKSKLAIVRCGVSFAITPPDRPFKSQARYRLGTLGRLVEKKESMS